MNCRICKGEIPAERLDAIPSTTLCVDCSVGNPPKVVHDPDELCAKASPSGANGWSPKS